MRYAMCGTEIAYGAMQWLCDVRVWCYAMCGTEIAYGAARIDKTREDEKLSLIHISEPTRPRLI
eukprot:3326232-Rhodomonas_salina.1